MVVGVMGGGGGWGGGLTRAKLVGDESDCAFEGDFAF